MKLENRSTHIIRYLSLALVFLLAVGAFAQSYAVLWDVALAYGLPPEMAWFWPLLVDGAIVVFSLAVVRNGLLGERTWWPWILVILFTLGTVALNGIHSDGRYVSIAVAVVAPIALVLAFETSMAMLKSDVRRSGLVLSIAQIEQETKEKREELDRAQHDQLVEIEAQATLRQTELDALLLSRQSELDKAERELETVRRQIAQAQAELSDISQKVEERRRELNTTQDATLVNIWDLIAHIDKTTLDTQARQFFVALLTNAKVTQRDIAEWTGKSIKTIQRDITECNGLIKR